VGNLGKPGNRGKMRWKIIKPEDFDAVKRLKGTHAINI